MIEDDVFDWERQDDLPLTLIKSSLDQRGLSLWLAEAIHGAPIGTASKLYRLAEALGIGDEVSAAVTIRNRVYGPVNVRIADAIARNIA